MVEDPTRNGPRRRPTNRIARRAALVGTVVVAAASVGLLVASSAPGAASPATHHSSGAVAAKAVAAASTAAVPSGNPVVAVPAVAPPVTTPTVPSPVPVTVPVASVPTVAALVAQVESAGIDPGPTWTWTMGDTSTSCGDIAGAGTATGCTSWASGVEHTVFAGTPALALVAHEVANAEAERDAVPSLVAQVTAAAAGTSWSPTDAVASCLVAHFLGFQDGAAGSWQCPAPLADTVAAHIHDTVTTTTTTAVCGTASHVVSTLTFTATAGTLTVTSPAGGPAPMTVAAGTPVTVTGIGTFTAVDQGGTATTSGVCSA